MKLLQLGAESGEAEASPASPTPTAMKFDNSGGYSGGLLGEPRGGGGWMLSMHPS